MAERIEPFSRDHLNECAHLIVATFNEEPWNDSWTLDTARKELTWTIGVPGFVGLVTLTEGVVAFATGYREPDDVRDVFYLKTFCVRPDVQGTGVGSRLIGHLKERLGEGGVNTIYLLTHKGTPAEAFYRKNSSVFGQVSEKALSRRATNKLRERCPRCVCRRTSLELRSAVPDIPTSKGA